ncbi:MAG TPA: hypothetical protein VJ742_12770 [Nitrososphaera sp.]|nr:hypothetical protein [Nitrososphaera sp.]
MTIAHSIWIHSLSPEWTLTETQVAAAWETISLRYSEPHRHYHTIEHIDEMIEVCFALSDGTHDRQLLMYASIFHDFYYNPQAHDNEELSANLAYDFALKAGMDKDFADRAKKLILGTKEHWAFDDDSAVLFDADLFRLASDRFPEHSANIRKEYSWVPDDLYREGRAKVLHSFLDREKIYQSPWGAGYEESARKNLQTALTELTKG